MCTWPPCAGSKDPPSRPIVWPGRARGKACRITRWSLCRRKIGLRPDSRQAQMSIRTLVQWADRIAETDPTGPHHLGAPPAMAAHRSIATMAKGFLHPATRRTNDRQVQNRIPNRNMPILHRGKVQARHHDIASQQRRIYRPLAQKRTNRAQMLRLYQRHRAFAGARPVPDQPGRVDLNLLDNIHLGPPRRAQAQPHHGTRLRPTRNHLMKLAHRSSRRCSRAKSNSSSGNRSSG
mmetsp:Transcript_29324/g.56996  ORF Transcript_29324/g.56996 Transcript_29324/m.56996 type:complete len:235 (+) Transcript_29324:1367-2071(+)